MKQSFTTILIPALLTAAHATAATFLTSGSYDAPAFEYESGDGFEAEIHDETNDTALDPADNFFQINSMSTTVFQSKSYYWIPFDETIASNNGVPHVGIGLEELSAGDWANSEIVITFQSLNFTGSGDGDFVLWTDSPSEILHFDSSDGAGDTLNSLAGSHVHYNWGFSDPGTYEIAFGISGTHVTDGAQTGGATYTFQVVPEPSSALLAGIGAIALLRRKR